MEEALLSGLYFTSSPDREEAFHVGDQVEVFCDHDYHGDRVRDWLVGTVVQVDQKMVAVQFQENVYLTDGWMVPDHVLWSPKTSTNIRKPVRRRRKVKSQARPVRTALGNDDDDDE
jgi:5S rRNA maturation endonuclease (ribonuclease M5)